MKAKYDWMRDLIKKNVTTAVSTVAVPGFEYAAGMTLKDVLLTAAPVVAPVVVGVAAVGYLASKRNQSNLEQQSTIQQTIDELNKEKLKIEGKISKVENGGTRRERQQYKKLNAELSNIEFEISIAEDKLKQCSSSSLVKITANAADSAWKMVSGVVSQAKQNITSAYNLNGGGIVGLGYAAHETAKYASQAPGVTGYLKAGLQVMAGNVLDGGVEAAVHTLTGVKVSVPEYLVDAMAKTNAQELKNGIVGGVSAIFKEVEETDQDLSFSSSNP